MALAAAKRRVICVGYVVPNAATASYANSKGLYDSTFAGERLATA